MGLADTDEPDTMISQPSLNLLYLMNLRPWSCHILVLKISDEHAYQAGSVRSLQDIQTCL